MPIYTLAAGLGKLNVNSGLGEPLKAEIELLSVTPEELSSLSAAVASEEAYAAQGITRLGIHNNIKVELTKNPDGSPVLKLRSAQPINDPYLDMLIQVDWASGRLLREYTILLDPPEYKQSIADSADVQVISPPGISSTYKPFAQSEVNASETTQHAVTKTKKSRKGGIKDTKSNIEHEVPAESVDAAAELTTQRGDTLSSIAKGIQPEGVSLDQMLVGLFEANRNAFVDGNINRLKVGQIIKVPSKDSLSAIDPRQAAKEIKVHSANWNAYRNNLAGNVMAAPVAEESEHKQSASGKISAAEDKAAVTKSGPQDVVKLSAGGKAAAKDGKAASEADAKVLALQEEATAKEKALKEAQERTAALETQIADMQKLLALKSQAMSNVQKNAEAAAKPAEVAAPAQSAPAVTPSPVAAETKTAEPAVAPVSAEKPAPEVAKKEPEAAQKDVSANNGKPAQAVAKVPVPAEPEEEASFFQSLLESVNLFMLGGAGGVALLGAGWVYLRNKRRKELDSFERGILTSGGLRANTVFGNTTGNASTSDTSFLTDFAQSADGSMIDTNDVDPIAEAEVYMAYGRDAQAEEILKDAILKEPKRYELHLKLLEMYAARKDVSAFEAISGELYTTLGADDPVWAKVAELGVTIEPDNPLYDVSQTPSSSVHKSSDADLKPADAEMHEDMEFALDDKLMPGDKDDVALDSQDSVPENKITADNSMDFDFPDMGALALNEQNATVSEQETAEKNDGESAFADLSVVSASDHEIQFPASPLEAAEEPRDFNFAETPAAQAEEMPATSPEFNFEGFAEAVTPAGEGKEEVSALDAIDFNFEGFGEPVSETNEVLPQGKPEINALDGISLDFDAEDAASIKADGLKAEEISFDFPLTDETQSAVPDLEITKADATEANNFDFSAISLDLGDTETKEPEVEGAAAVGAEPTVAAEKENPDVDIKLDLIKVYIDMEDIEGARDLLDEVLKEGGPQQRLTAEKLLTSLT